MAIQTQSNNLVILEKDGSGNIRTINPDAANGDRLEIGAGMLLNGSGKVQISATGGLDLDSLFDFDGSSFDVASSGDIALATGGNTIEVQAPTIYIGTDSAGDTANTSIAIGSGTAVGASLTLEAGTGSVLAIGQSSNATVNVGVGAYNQSLNYGTGAAVKTVQVGSTNTTSTTTIAGGASGSIVIGANTATVNAGAGSTTQTLNFGTGAGAKTVTVGSTNTTSSLSLQAGSGGIQLDGALALKQEGGIRVENGSGGALAVGCVVAIKTSDSPTSIYAPKVLKADANAASDTARRFAGVIVGAELANAATGIAAAIAGTVCGVNFSAGGAPASSADTGKPVYLSPTAGEATLVAPVSPGDTLFQIGNLVSHTAISGSRYAVQLAPQILGTVPA
jgi:hypothetical protein